MQGLLGHSPGTSRTWPSPASVGCVETWTVVGKQITVHGEDSIGCVGTWTVVGKQITIHGEDSVGCVGKWTVVGKQITIHGEDSEVWKHDDVSEGWV